MSAGDWFFGVFFAPVMMCVLWTVCYHVWRSDLDVGEAVDWFTGQGGLPGYHAFILPACLSMTTGWLAAMGLTIRGEMDSPPAWTEQFVNYTGVASIGFLLLGFWLWIFKWPKFMVPRRFRTRRRDRPAER